ncbi:MAG TPA: hypothetical protein VN628_03865 [Vicinamibacterales bacterium]|nr:hypothetical protein [Vicinamibacterales bacterium]
MTAERIYAALLRMYPAPFREEYGGEMLSVFRDLRASRRSTPVRFWSFVLRDVFTSAARERLEGTRWLAAALFGLAATVATARLATFVYRYFYHPYFEDTAIRPLPYGLLLGIVLGLSVAGAQWVLFPAAERRAGRWALVSAVTLPVAILFCSTAVEQALDGLNPVVHIHHPLALDLLVVGFGRPGDWSGIAAQFFAMAASALVIRLAMPDLKVRRYSWDSGRHAD